MRGQHPERATHAPPCVEARRSAYRPKRGWEFDTRSERGTATTAAQAGAKRRKREWQGQIEAGSARTGITSIPAKVNVAGRREPNSACFTLRCIRPS